MSKACYKCMRILVIIFNFLFVLIGVAILACAIFVSVDKTAMNLVNSTGRLQYINIALYVLMGVGAVTILIGLFGCCGAYHESQCLLAIYFIFLLFIFAAQVAAGVMGFLYKKEIFKTVDKRLEDMVKEKKDSGNKETAIDHVQRLLRCCGAEGKLDYALKIPRSCCNSKVNEKICSRNIPIVTAVTAYNTGCAKAYKSFVDKYFFIILIVVLGIAFIEFLGLVFAIALCCNVRSRERAYQTVETHEAHLYS